MDSADQAARGVWKRRAAYGLRRVKRFLARASGTPHQIALGMAVGFFIGWLPIMGIQMVVAAVICGMLRCNPVVPILPIWIINPVTFVPIYSFNYGVGRLLAGGPPASEVIGKTKDILAFSGLRADPWSNLPAWAYGWTTEFFRNARRSARGLWDLGLEMMVPLWLGCCLLGLLLAVASYYYTRWLVTRLRERRMRPAAAAAGEPGPPPFNP